MTLAKPTDKKPHLYRDAEFEGARPEDRVCTRCGLMEWQEAARGTCLGPASERDGFKDLPRTSRPRRAPARKQAV